MVVGLSDAAGQPVSVVGPEPNPATPISSSEATGEPKSIQEPAGTVGKKQKSVQPGAVADGDSALGSVWETPGASEIGGSEPGMQDQPLDVDVRLAKPPSKASIDVY